MNDTGFTSEEAETFDEFRDDSGTRSAGDNPSRARFVAEPFQSITVQDEREFLIQDVAPRKGLAVLCGESGSAKTFLAIYLCSCIAMSRAWGGKAVEAGATVYVTAEGASGVRKRIVALQHRDKPEGHVPFYLIADSLDLGHADGDAQPLINRIKDQIDEPISLVVIDTLARAMAGADEKDSADMTVFVNNCDRIASAFDCLVMVVHHLGKDAARGARGSTVLKAAADLELMVDGTDGERTVSITKARDGEDGLIMSFVLERVDIDANDQPLSSCVVRVTRDWQFAGGEAKRQKITGAAKLALNALQLAIEEAGEYPPADSRANRTKKVVRSSLWRKYADKLQISETDKPDTMAKAFKRAADKLQSVGKIGVWDEWVWINE